MEPEVLNVAKIQRVVDAHGSDLAHLGVQSLAVFGSVARGEATGDSDIDFLVEFTGGATLARYMDLKFLLEGLFGRQVDLVTRKSLRSRLQPFVEKDAVRVA
jgi:predicted nucleotidyltransferase